ncbi:hypothetical protein EOE48_24025 [Methylobacterium oryzihabitans]|uniref:Uncharacterized protein n=1 Tax=Methylobacterium oryzihabitans TaxID=2499852 RepID=A0A3S2YM51_9HYPH|nr:hypothetical protein EOE48_24025 [Methylobacterium oryzihabitans]
MCAFSSPRLRGEGIWGSKIPHLVVADARRQPRVRGRFRRSLLRNCPLTLALRAPRPPNRG